MSTQTLTPPALRRPVKTDRVFYLVMALAATALIFIGFSQSFYLRSPTFPGPALSALVIVHGLLFSLWMVYFVLQTALIAVRRPALHRRLGIFGAVLGALLIVLGLAVAFAAVRLHHGSPTQDAETIFLVALGDITTFSLFFITGYLFRRDRETHQRLMLYAVVAGLIGPALGRLAGMGVPGPALPLLDFAFLLAGPIYDLVTRRRIHPAYIYGLIFAIVTLPPLRFTLGHTPWWHHMAHVIAGA